MLLNPRETADLVTFTEGKTLMKNVIFYVVQATFLPHSIYF